MSEGKLIYTGEYKLGQRHGFGAYYPAEGHMYVGRFMENDMNGIGIFFYYTFSCFII